jgi:hypothetical protein
MTLENIAYQAVIFAQVQAFSIAGNNTGSILPAMLLHRQSVIEFLINRRMGYKSDNATHT